MIREATMDDMPRLIEMGRLFYGASIDGKIEFDETGTIDMFSGFIASPQACVFISDDGFICGVLTQLPYLSKTFYVAQECFWWAGMTGAQLLAAFVEWANASGASRIVISHRHSEQTPAFERLYRMRGFAPYEHYYMRAH